MLIAKMDFLTKFFNKASDCQLIINLKPNQVSAVLIQSKLFLAQLHLAEAQPQSCLDSLQAFLQQHGCTRPEVTIVLSEGCYQQAQLDKPAAVPDEEMVAALQWSVKELINIPPENMQLDYYDMPTIGVAKRITVIAAEKSWLQEWINFCVSKLKGAVKTVQVEELALINLLPDENNPTLLLWQRPNEDIDLLVVYQHALYFSRRLRGTATLNQTQGELLAGMVDQISLEVQRALDYFESNLRQPPVRTVQMLLDGEQKKIVQELMTANLSIPVEQLLPKQQQQMNFPAEISHFPLLGALYSPAEGVTYEAKS